jgi:hypothetical protein
MKFFLCALPSLAPLLLPHLRCPPRECPETKFPHLFGTLCALHEPTVSINLLLSGRKVLHTSLLEAVQQRYDSLRNAFNDTLHNQVRQTCHRCQESNPQTTSAEENLRGRQAPPQQPDDTAPASQSYVSSNLQCAIRLLPSLPYLDIICNLLPHLQAGMLREDLLHPLSALLADILKSVWSSLDRLSEPDRLLPVLVYFKVLLQCASWKDLSNNPARGCCHLSPPCHSRSTCPSSRSCPSS